MDLCRICSNIPSTSKTSTLKSLNQMIRLDSKEITITRAIKTCFNIKIRSYVGSSNLICMACLKLLYQSHFFRKRCKVAARYLETAHEIEISAQDDFNDDSCLVDDIEDFKEQPITFVCVGDKDISDPLDCKEEFESTDTFEEEIGSPDSIIEIARNSTKGPTLCHLCGKLIMRFYSHSCSQNLHIKNIKCPQCESFFHSNKNLSSHVETVHKKNLLCSFCARVFGKHNHLAVHMRQHTGETPYKCELCECSFKQRVLLRNHMKSKHNQTLPDTYTTSQINRDKETPSNIIQKKRKIKDSSLDSPKKSRRAKFSNDLFEENIELEEDPCKEMLCNICGQIVILEHFTEHSNSHNFEIDSQINLQPEIDEYPILMATYDNFVTDTPLKCIFCSLEFMENILLQQHIISKHTSIRNDPSLNASLKISFDDDDDRKMRGKYANDKSIKLYPCEYCQESFTKKKSCIKHLQLSHSSSWLCHFCGERVLNQLRFCRHLKTHSTYPCEICNDEFPAWNSLEHHMKKIHS